MAATKNNMSRANTFTMYFSYANSQWIGFGHWLGIVEYSRSTPTDYTDHRNRYSEFRPRIGFAFHSSLAARSGFYTHRSHVWIRER